MSLIGNGAAAVGQKPGAGKDEHQSTPSVRRYPNIDRGSIQLNSTFIRCSTISCHAVDIDGGAHARKPGTRICRGMHMEVIVRRILVWFQPGAAGKEGSGPQTSQDDRSPIALHPTIRSGNASYFVRSGHPTFSPVAQFLTAWINTPCPIEGR